MDDVCVALYPSVDIIPSEIEDLDSGEVPCSLVEVPPVPPVTLKLVTFADDPGAKTIFALCVSLNNAKILKCATNITNIVLSYASSVSFLSLVIFSH